MAQVKVWNDNEHPYYEEFRDKKVSIPPKKFVLMEADEAHLFKCNFAPIKVDADGNPSPEGYKRIRIEELPDSQPETKPVQSGFICQADGSVHETEAELKAHIEANFKDQILVDEEAEQALRKRGPGRPKKTE
jgi:hypothetical protein